MKSNKGMGMIQLIIVIACIVLIVAMGIYYIRMKYIEAKVQTVKTDMLLVEWKLKDYVNKQTVAGEEKKFLGTKVSELKDDALVSAFLEKNIISEEEYEKFYVLKDEDLALAGLEITNYENSYFLINYDTDEVIVTKGNKYSDSEVLYRLSDIEKKTQTENTNTEINEVTNE